MHAWAEVCHLSQTERKKGSGSWVNPWRQWAIVTEIHIDIDKILMCRILFWINMGLLLEGLDWNNSCNSWVWQLLAVAVHASSIRPGGCSCPLLTSLTWPALVGHCTYVSCEHKNRAVDPGNILCTEEEIFHLVKNTPQVKLYCSRINDT